VTLGINGAMAGYAAEPAEGPLWNHFKSQLYKPEVKMIKRLVGHQLIQQNRLMWDEIWSLRQMLAEFRGQNDELCRGRRQHADLCDTQHRELLKRQAHLLLNDLRSKANGCGHALEDMVPELRGSEIYRHLLEEDSCGSLGGPPATPSTRPSTASTRSCTTPDLIQNLATLPSLPMGKALGMEDMDDVALGLREALEAEHQWLLASIEEEYQLLSLEEERRKVNGKTGASVVSTAELKRFLHRLQEIAVSPSLRTLAMAPESEKGTVNATTTVSGSAPALGGANIRRLQALITMRRQTGALHTVEEKGPPSAAAFGGPTIRGPDNQEFDPFFGDPI